MTPTLALLTVATSWWDRLTLPQQLFYGIGLAAGLVALVLVVMALLGMEHDDALDAVATGDVGDSGGVFSTKPLTGFFLGFGWAGGASLESGASLGLSLLAAMAAGGLLMAAIVAMFRVILSLRSDGTARIEHALGASGTVYVTVPPKRSSGGQVTVTFAGRQETYDAITDAETALPSGTLIKVTAVIPPRTLQVSPQ